MLSDEKTALKSFKYTWMGSQRQLVELFDVLIANKWISIDIMSEEKQSLPIIEMFNIIKSDSIQSINHKSFRKQWQKDGEERNSISYKPIFDNVVKNPRSSKK